MSILITDVNSQQLSSDECRVVPLRLELLPSSSRNIALDAWRKLETELSNQRLMCSSIWTETWLESFGSTIPHQFALGYRQGRLCGIALLTQGVEQTVGPFRLNTWHVGTAGEPSADSVCVEHNALLVVNRDRVEFGAALRNWAMRQSSCDEFRMDGFAAARTAPLLTLHPDATVVQKPARYFDLDAVRTASAEVLSRLGYNTRSAVRRTLRNLGHVRGEWAETSNRAEEFFREMIQLHQARWTSVGKPGSYASDRFREFHLALLHRAVPRGVMGLFRLTDGTRTIGCVQILHDNNRALVYQCGWNTLGGSISPGLATDYLCMCECLRRGFDAYDFLAGDGEHKRRLSTEFSDLAWVVWRRPTFKNAVVDGLRRIKLAVTQLAKAPPGIPTLMERTLTTH